MILLIIGLLLAFNLQQSEAQVGVCYKTPGKNETLPEEAIVLLERHNIKRIRLYEPNKETLTALKCTDIKVLLGVPNSVLLPLANDPATAESWVQTNVKAYSPDVRFKYLVVGNEISTNNMNNPLSFILINAMRNIQNALAKQGLRYIKVTTAFDTSVLNNPFTDRRPSNISFVVESLLFLDPILKFLLENHAPVIVNIYPYYAHILNPTGSTLDYALFNASGGNLFVDLVDSMYSALKKMGYDSIDVVVGETGWPSACGVAASVENQKTYISKLRKQIKKGTPMKPNRHIETYLYSVFDEDIQGVPEVEKHWGLFTPNKELKFEFSRPLNDLS